jgi:hypothetical protein
MIYGTPQIVRNGLVLYLDAANQLSYISGSTVWRDLSGNGNNATLVNYPTFSSANGGSIAFDGVDDYANFGNTNISISCTINQWIQPLSGSVNTMRTVELVSVNSATAVLYSQLKIISGVWRHQILVSGYPAGYDEEMNVYSQSNVTQFVTNNTPYNFCFTWERIPGGNSTLNTYLNGIFREREINTNNFWANTASLSTSTYRISPTYKGNISVNSFYNRSLSPQEILQNYNATKGRFNL